jgi:hypothetical protein
MDGYTIIKQEGIEAGIPHCYVKEEEIIEILEGFQIMSLCKIQDYVGKER